MSFGVIPYPSNRIRTYVPKIGQCIFVPTCPGFNGVIVQRAEFKPKEPKQLTLEDLPYKVMEKILGYVELADLARFATTSCNNSCIGRNIVNTMISNANLFWNNGVFHENILVELEDDETLETDMDREQMVASLADAMADDPQSRKGKSPLIMK